MLELMDITKYWLEKGGLKDFLYKQIKGINIHYAVQINQMKEDLAIQVVKLLKQIQVPEELVI